MADWENAKIWISSLRDPGETYTLQYAIGKGNSARVYKGTNQAGLEFAVKVHSGMEESRLKWIYAEYLVYEAVKQNPRFPTFHGAFRKDAQVWLVLEVCQKMRLLL